jgi:hypothetical protein
MGKKTKKKIKNKKISNLKGGEWFTPAKEIDLKPVRTEIKRFERANLELKKGIFFKSTKYIPKEIVEFNGKKYSIETTKDMLGRRKIIIRDRESGDLLERKADPTTHFILRNYIKKYPTQGFHDKNIEIYHQYYNGSQKHKFLRQHRTTKNMLETPQKIKKPRNWWSLGLFRKKKAFTKTINVEEPSLEETRDRVRALEAQAAKNSAERAVLAAEARAKEIKVKLEADRAQAAATATKA